MESSNKFSILEVTDSFLDSLKGRFFQLVRINGMTINVRNMIEELSINEYYRNDYSSYIQNDSQFRQIFKKLKSIGQTTENQKFLQIIDDVKTQFTRKFISKKENNQLKKLDSNILTLDVNKDSIPEKQIEKPLIYNSEEIVIEIRYLDSEVKYLTYESKGYSLKEWTERYIKKYLKQNKIIVKKSTSELMIMEDVDFSKSLDAGNYRINHLLDCVQIWISRSDKKPLERDFIVQGDMDAITFDISKYKQTQWNKIIQKLNPKNSIEKMINCIYEKKQWDKKQIQNIINKFQDQGAFIIQELFPWTLEQYRKLSIKLILCFEIDDLVSQIKYSKNINRENNSSCEQRKQCKKVANSHKLLRYMVYKTDGVEELKKLPWLNFENVDKAFIIIRKVIQNQSLLNNLQSYFERFALTSQTQGKKNQHYDKQVYDPDDQSVTLQRGMILHGPPGTGKTQLTELLPSLIGFHLISKGLSAADFMKSYVGQTGRMIKDMAYRASYTPYLLCSLAIDQVDGIVKSRKDKEEKKNVEGVSAFLSLVGGNQDVPNLIYMTSTNYLKKIDEAIQRRWIGHFMVGRPDPEQRKSLLLEMLGYFKNQEALLKLCVEITANFTGAALKNLANNLLGNLKIKKQKKQKKQQKQQKQQKMTVSLNSDQIIQQAHNVADKFKITLGSSTLPRIYRNQINRKFILTEAFLSKITNNFVLVKYNRGDQFQIIYANEIKKFVLDKLIPIYQKQEDRINIPIGSGSNPFQALTNYIKVLFKNQESHSLNNNSPQECEIKIYCKEQYQDYRKYLKDIKDFSKEKKMAKKTILIVQYDSQHPDDVNYQAKFFQKNITNLYIIYYIGQYLDSKKFTSAFFGLSKEKNVLMNQSGGIQKKADYSGRILVQLNGQARMAFEFKNCMPHESQVAFRLFLKSQTTNTANNFILELIEFFTKKKVRFILYIDQNLLLQNEAFDENKILEILEEKISEARSYDDVAVIINVDSIIKVQKNESNSSMGLSKSSSMHQPALYSNLLNYMSDFANISRGNNKWMAIIVKHPYLIQTLKQDLYWPLYPEQIEKEKVEKKLDVDRKCIRCNEYYTERQNTKKRTCMQHPGRIIDLIQGIPLPENQKPENVRGLINFERLKGNNVQQCRFIYNCCNKSINEPGHEAYYHISSTDQYDELKRDRFNQIDKLQNDFQSLIRRYQENKNNQKTN